MSEVNKACNSGLDGDTVEESGSDEDQWEYYDDNTTLTDFWQVNKTTHKKN